MRMMDAKLSSLSNIDHHTQTNSQKACGYRLQTPERTTSTSKIAKAKIPRERCKEVSFEACELGRNGAACMTEAHGPVLLKSWTLKLADAIENSSRLKPRIHRNVLWRTSKILLSKLSYGSPIEGTSCKQFLALTNNIKTLKEHYQSRSHFCKLVCIALDMISLTGLIYRCNWLLVVHEYNKLTCNRNTLHTIYIT